MTVCSWCGSEMATGESCCVRALHKDGRPFPLAPFGHERGRRRVGERCGDCGVARGGWHHPGCDLQPCPACGRQLLSCGCRFDEDGDDDELGGGIGGELVEVLGVDGNGNLVERRLLGGIEVIVHYDDVPAGDIATLDGIRCTTPLRTVIDMAPEVSRLELESMVRQCLDRGLFTLDEAWDRLAQADMATRPGARLLRQVLPPLG